VDTKRTATLHTRFSTCWKCRHLLNLWGIWPHRLVETTTFERLRFRQRRAGAGSCQPWRECRSRFDACRGRARLSANLSSGGILLRLCGRSPWTTHYDAVLVQPKTSSHLSLREPRARGLSTRRTFRFGCEFLLEKGGGGSTSTSTILSSVHERYTRKKKRLSRLTSAPRVSGGTVLSAMGGSGGAELARGLHTTTRRPWGSPRAGRGQACLGGAPGTVLLYALVDRGG